MDKPFKTIDEQIGILESRGLACDPETKEILSRESYYAIVNGYKQPFLAPDFKAGLAPERFVPGTTFEQLYCLYRFDRALRSVMMRHFAEAEAVLKTTCSYCFSEHHREDPEAYLEPSSYDSRGRGRAKAIINLTDRFRRELGRTTSGKTSHAKSSLPWK